MTIDMNVLRKFFSESELTYIIRANGYVYDYVDVRVKKYVDKPLEGDNVVTLRREIWYKSGARPSFLDEGVINADEVDTEFYRYDNVVKYVIEERILDFLTK